MKRKKEFVVERGVLEGRGPTKTEAKAELERKIDNALEGYFDPKLIHWPGSAYAVLVYRIPQGWQYSIMESVNGLHSLRHTGFYAERDRSEVENYARMHLAQLLFNFEAGSGEEVITDPQDLAEHHSWCRWQYRFRYWKGEGFSSDDCHRRASEPSTYPVPAEEEFTSSLTLEEKAA